MIEALDAENLWHVSGIRHGFFTRQGGVSAGIYESLNVGLLTNDAPVSIDENRNLVAQHMGVPNNRLLSCRQVHSADVVTVTKPWAWAKSPTADAMVTKLRGVVLSLVTADCAPVLFVDPDAAVIGAAHAGWRGALSGVLENTVMAMEALGADRERVRAAVGPCIWEANYEVGPEFAVHLRSEPAENRRFLKPFGNEGKFHFDLSGFVVSRLSSFGLADIAASPADTFADRERFFSYRRSQIENKTETGRQASAIMMTEG
jgi:YfiH family protein